MDYEKISPDEIEYVSPKGGMSKHNELYSAMREAPVFFRGMNSAGAHNFRQRHYTQITRFFDGKERLSMKKVKVRGELGYIAQIVKREAK